jgi:hypothetical protein
MALALEAPLLARRLAEQGAKYYPENEALDKFARILAPPKVSIGLRVSELDVRANNNWIHTHREEYKGLWVALKNGKLMETGQTFSELREKVGSIKGKGILVTQVT